jgi:(4-(4-[2-(gamma-L-glutamylamino)ethyl]phenoxymethyl)furan-2-yl)methanamine synthase
MSTVGWDIGGVNTKGARVVGAAVMAVRSRPYELQRDPRALAPLLREVCAGLDASDADRHAVTMTAELSQMFRTKREGVSFVLDAVEAAFPSSQVRVFAVDGDFLTTSAARLDPLRVAAANWAATAQQVAASHRDVVLVDIGTTSTDIIPIVDGRVAAKGLTDPARLASGELVYTGAVRTTTEAIASHVPLHGEIAGVSAEAFALAGDVHVWRGDLAPFDYTCPTPDGRPPTRPFAGERLARVVCGDREMLSEAAISEIADALARAQVERIASAILRVVARHASLRRAVVTGLGAFIGTRAARAAGLEVVHLAEGLGDAAARCAPAASVALLLERDSPTTTHRPSTPARGARSNVEGRGTEAPRATARRNVVVVKIGGGLLNADALDAVLAVIGDVAGERRVLIVPGGGPFADVVRDVDRRLHLSDEAAHWMAILAMDQYAHAIASRLPQGLIVDRADAIVATLDAGRVPIIAPSSWLREVDPLPHSWEVTSDSIAAWIAGQVGASSVVLVKPPHASGDDLVDAHFTRTLSTGITSAIVTADRIDVLRAAITNVEPARA